MISLKQQYCIRLLILELISLFDEIVLFHSPDLEIFLEINDVLVEGSSEKSDLLVLAENFVAFVNTEG